METTLFSKFGESLCQMKIEAGKGRALKFHDIDRAKFEAYGKICWLWTQSNLHVDWPTDLQSRLILPAIERKQFKIVEQDGLPVAYCSWAMIDKETETRFILSPSSIHPKDWTSGDRLWFVDWVSPFSARYTRVLRKSLAEQFPNHVARSIRVKRGKEKARIATYVGRDLKRSESHALRRQYFQEVAEGLQKNPELGKSFTLS